MQPVIFISMPLNIDINEAVAKALCILSDAPLLTTLSMDPYPWFSCPL